MGFTEEKVLQLLNCNGAAVNAEVCTPPCASLARARPSRKQVNIPPVVVELPVTEAEQLGREVHG